MMLSNLAEDEYDKLSELVSRVVDERLKSISTGKTQAVDRANNLEAKDPGLIERIIRIEEELKALREIQIVQLKSFEKRFETIDKRFEALQREMNARFEAMDKRFEALQREMNARFEAMQREMNARFEAMQREMNARFEAMDKRFEAMDKRFEAMDKRFTTLQWTMGLGFSVIIAFMGLLKFWH